MQRLRNRYLFLLDAILLAIVPFFVYLLRFEGVRWGPRQVQTVIVFTAVTVPTRLLIYFALGIYRTLWRYASVGELELVFVAGVTGSVASFILGGWLLPAFGASPEAIPISPLFSNALLSIACLAGPRLLIRAGGLRMLRPASRAGHSRVLIAGAGTAAQAIVREMRQNPDLQLEPVGFLDDDPAMRGMRIGNLPILGNLSDVAKVVKRYRVQQVVVAMPSAPGTVIRELVRAALDAGVETRTVPSLGEILSGRVSVGTLRNVEIEDLLRREPIQTDLARVAKLTHDRVVLVTGAGGSIGSELCRQIAALGPAKLVLVGHGENPIFEILNELRKKHTGVDFVPVIADIRDIRRVREVFDVHHPFTVFHAAAHKHVPLMEGNVVEAVTNNVLGTKNIVDVSVDSGVQHFVFISTDKAVRPTNVMGASKRVAEHVVRRAALKAGKNFVAVRFGNVLGSRGSVIPTFVRQIQEGGPVTVTHPEMRRFFMTIPEAVQLTLQAGALGKGGELFMLDMGEPVKVVDLARDLIRLSGLKEGDDIAIEFTGIRPGEKLYEEMFFSDELAEPTEHPKVLRARKETAETWGDHLIDQLIQSAVNGASAENLRAMLRVIVPDFVSDQPGPMMPTPGFGVPVIADVAPVGKRRNSKPGSSG